MSGIAHQKSSQVPVVGGATGQTVNSANVDIQQSGGNKPAQKRSVDYLLRSGLAGGLAGCAVSPWRRSQSPG